MESTDERTRDILEIREHLAKEAERYETALEYTRRNIAILDSLLIKSSFTRASDIKRGPDEPPREDAAPEEPAADDAETDGAIPIMADSETVAHARVTPDEVSVAIADGVRLTADTPPLRTFFVERIIAGMRAKDDARAKSGEIDADSVITCDIREDAGAIREIVVRNYRDKPRADEIVASVSWSLARMVENSAG